MANGVEEEVFENKNKEEKDGELSEDQSLCEGRLKAKDICIPHLTGRTTVDWRDEDVLGRLLIRPGWRWLAGRGDDH